MLGSNMEVDIPAIWPLLPIQEDAEQAIGWGRPRGPTLDPMDGSARAWAVFLPLLGGSSCAGLGKGRAGLVSEPMRGSRRPRAAVPAATTSEPIGRRPLRVYVRMNQEEYALMAGQAAQQGLSIPRFLMESAQAGSAGETITERRALLTELVGVRRLLANAANNINQLAKAANSGGSVPAAQSAAELEMLRRLGERIRSAVEELMRR